MSIESDGYCLDPANEWLTYLLIDIKLLHCLIVQLKALCRQRALINAVVGAHESLQLEYELREQFVNQVR